jgi:prepilin-type N-terminal cleavage/methylation domain-containing protein
MQLSKESLGSGSKGNAGFTLIELAIVLVVIGLIIAAVLKGESLITNARMLDFITNPIQKAQTEALDYYDRTGQFPSGVTSGNSTNGPLYNMYQVGINGVLSLKTPFTQGSDSLGMALGTISVTDSSGNTANYPVIAIQPVNVSGTGVSSTTWTNSELGYANYLKSKIDGSTSSWTTGSVRMLDASIQITYTPLSNEITPTPTTSTYDGSFTTNTTPYTTTDFVVAPAAGQSYPLVYFYNQQPH